MSEMPKGRFGGLGALQIIIIVLVVVTALVHLQRGIGMSSAMPPGGPGGPPPASVNGTVPAGNTNNVVPPSDANNGSSPNGGQGGSPLGGRQPGFNILQLIPIPLPILFLLNGIGYLVLVAALYLPPFARFQSIVRWLLILFTTVTIVLYFWISGVRVNPVGLFDKVVEIVLVILLFVEGNRAKRMVTAFAT